MSADEDVLVFNPNLTLHATHYQGKYIEMWLREHGKDDIIVKAVSKSGLRKSASRNLQKTDII